jgi:hypothetical protein
VNTPQLALTPEPDPVPPPSAIRARLQDCDVVLDDGQRVCMTHRTTGVQASGSEDTPTADLLGAVQAEIDRLDQEVTWLGALQVRGAGLVPGLLERGLDDALRSATKPGAKTADPAEKASSQPPAIEEQPHA